MLQKFPISQELVCSLFVNEMLLHADTCTLISGGSVLRGCVPRAGCDSPHMLPILEHSSPLLPQTLPPTTDTLKSPHLSNHPPVLTPLPHLLSPTRTIKDAWSLPSAPLPPPHPRHTHPPFCSSQIPGYSPNHTHCLFPFTITDKVTQADERRARGSQGVPVEP